MNIYTATSLLASTLCLGLAVLAFVSNRKSKEAVPFGISSALIGCWTMFPVLMFFQTNDATKLIITRWLYTAAALVPFSFWYMYFLVMGFQEKRDKWVLRYMFFFSFPLIWLTWSPSYIRSVDCSGPMSYINPGPTYLVFVGHFLAMGCYGIFRMMVRWRGDGVNQASRNKYKYLFLSFGVALCGALIHFVAAYAKREPLPHDIFIIAFVCILAYAILRHRLMDITIIIRRALIYSVVTGALTVIYLGIVTLFARLFQGLTGYQTVFSSAAAAGVITIFFQPIRKRAQDFIDSKFFRQYVDREEKLYELSRDVVTHIHPEAMAEALMRVLGGTFHPKSMALYLCSADGNGFSLAAGEKPSAFPPGMPSDNALAAYLQDHPQPFVNDRPADIGETKDTRRLERKEDAA